MVLALRGAPPQRGAAVQAGKRASSKLIACQRIKGGPHCDGAILACTPMRWLRSARGDGWRGACRLDFRLVDFRLVDPRLVDPRLVDPRLVLAAVEAAR